MLLQAALNGARARAAHPAIPLTPDELAADAAAAVAAGAGALHVHPRDASGAESLDAETIAAALEAIRAACPGVPVGVSTGQWIAPGGAARRAAMRGWRVLPDYVSINLVEADAPEIAAIALEMGIGIEAGLWSRGDVARFLHEPWADRVLRVLVEINEQGEDAALGAFEGVMAELDEGGHAGPVLSHGLDTGFWPVLAAARRAGHDLRIGLEDVLVLPDGTPASGNAALVAAAVEIAR
ncbi:3-keto-5-aminohexanoate cleavage protein [Salinarimonas ramus]|uniref:3-keto-5-aminohexanoate cleavage enzyme n=1 Tax=Salinarimonas ramus TaxID=690164 RepID=A0A917Q473_9HYPH|nr:3-keto-5-aminohexanoate cleavage protein [Salinarimonas ramus]GGK19247.1 3-keto-5-aminohexanoate cleavage enzyme [Salinarimonas ramus]